MSNQVGGTITLTPPPPTKLANLRWSAQVCKFGFRWGTLTLRELVTLTPRGARGVGSAAIPECTMQALRPRGAGGRPPGPPLPLRSAFRCARPVGVKPLGGETAECICNLKLQPSHSDLQPSLGRRACRVHLKSGIAAEHFSVAIAESWLQLQDSPLHS